jgi:RNA polymerase sigma-70 factor (ECF subfamily)
MHTTPVSLLERLRRPADQDAWERFVQLYTPLLYSWAHRRGLQDQDAADLVQDVLLILVRKLPEFAYDRHKSFRGWLRTILLNRWRNRQRLPPAEPLQDIADPAGPDVAEMFAETEYRRRLVERALELMRTDFEPVTWKAFWEFHVAGRAAAEVAAELGLRPGSVYMAKARVLQRLREERDGLLD